MNGVTCKYEHNECDMRTATSPGVMEVKVVKVLTVMFIK